MHARIHTDVGDLAVHPVGEAPRLILWPGLFFDSRQHRPLAERLAALGWGSLLVDPPGFGDSGAPPEGIDLPACGRALVQVARAAGVQRPVLGGTSWGGIAALHAGLDAPEQVAAVLLMNTPFGGGAARGVIRFLPWLVRLPSGLVARGASASAFGDSALERDGERLRLQLEDTLRRANRRTLPHLVRVVLHERPSLRDRLDDLRVPALVVTASEDALVPPRRRPLPEAMEHLHVHGAGHSAALEDPATVADGILAFLEHHPEIGLPHGAPAEEARHGAPAEEARHGAPAPTPPPGRSSPGLPS